VKSYKVPRGWRQVYRGIVRRGDMFAVIRDFGFGDFAGWRDIDGSDVGRGAAVGEFYGVIRRIRKAQKGKKV
jgi:hypothetical protein